MSKIQVFSFCFPTFLILKTTNKELVWCFFQLHLSLKRYATSSPFPIPTFTVLSSSSSTWELLKVVIKWYPAKDPDSHTGSIIHINIQILAFKFSVYKYLLVTLDYSLPPRACCSPGWQGGSCSPQAPQQQLQRTALSCLSCTLNSCWTLLQVGVNPRASSGWNMILTFIFVIHKVNVSAY